MQGGEHRAFRMTLIGSVRVLEIRLNAYSTHFEANGRLMVVIRTSSPFSHRGFFLCTSASSHRLGHRPRRREAAGWVAH